MIQIVFAHAQTKSPLAPFGNGDSLPWPHCRQDLHMFKETTKGTVLVMGSKTFQSLPGKLPGRPHVVLTNSGLTPEAKDGSVADWYAKGPLEEILGNIEEEYPGMDISIIGGAGLIIDALPYADKVVKTTIWTKEELESDVKIDLTKVFLKFPQSISETTLLPADDSVIEMIIVREYEAWKTA